MNPNPRSALYHLTVPVMPVVAAADVLLRYRWDDDDRHDVDCNVDDGTKATADEMAIAEVTVAMKRIILAAE